MSFSCEFLARFSFGTWSTAFLRQPLFLTISARAINACALQRLFLGFLEVLLFLPLCLPSCSCSCSRKFPPESVRTPKGIWFLRLCLFPHASHSWLCCRVNFELGGEPAYCSCLCASWRSTFLPLALRLCLRLSTSQQPAPGPQGLPGARLLALWAVRLTLGYRFGQPSSRACGALWAFLGLPAPPLGGRVYRRPQGLAFFLPGPSGPSPE